MEVVTRKFIKCPNCGHLIPIKGKRMSNATKKKIRESLKKNWDEKRKARARAGS